MDAGQIREEIREVWAALGSEERLELFAGLDHVVAEELFLDLVAADQAELMDARPPVERRTWIRMLAPDDCADMIQEASGSPSEYLDQLDTPTRREVEGLLAYAEDQAGGLMSPRFARIRPDITADGALTYLRRQARAELETVYTLYVLDADQRLMGVLSLRDLLLAEPKALVSDLMTPLPRVRVAHVGQDQETLAAVFSDQGLQSIPVLDDDGRMQGIVTIDDIVDVVQEEATEDFQKMGGLEALDEPYLRISFGGMLRKRAGWLTALFLGEMLTATAMGYFEGEIARAVVLALFVPLIISSGGNSGSQATTLVIRAMALGEVRPRDWWRIARRELGLGLCLGIILGLVGLLRIFIWQHAFGTYTANWPQIAIIVPVSLVGVVMFGTLSGSMLPLLLRRVGFDPASASAPFVATLVDVTGLVIYFLVAHAVLRGAL